MKKRMVIVSGIIAVLLIIVALIVMPKSTKNGITKYQLLEKVTEQFAISEYTNKTPYYADVVASSEYFDMVQSAKEWGIISEESIFNGNEIIDGEYTVLLVMKAIGKYKIQIYLETMDELTDDDYVDLALEKGVIEKSQLKKGVSEEEIDLILSKAKELYLHELWKDDVCEIEYKEDVVEIGKDDILEYNQDYFQVRINDNFKGLLQIGTAVLLEHSKTGEKFLRRVSEITDGNIYVMEEVEAQEVIEHVLISDITSISLEDIDISNDLSIRNGERHTLESVYYYDDDADFDDYSKEIVIGNGTATVSITGITVGVQAYGRIFDIPEYVNVQTEANIEIAGEFSAEGEWVSDPIASAKVPLANGMLFVEIEFYLVVSANGTVKIETVIPVQAGIEYADERLRNPEADISLEKAEIIAEGETECYARTEVVPRLVGVKMPILDLEGDVGVYAAANVTTRLTEKVRVCADLVIRYPIIKVMVSGDKEKETWIKELGVAEEAKVWEIMNAENAIGKNDVHFEWYSDGTHKRVEECTYGKDISNIVEEFNLDRTWGYYADLKSSLVDEGDYYSVVADLGLVNYITADKLSTIKAGETYVIHGKQLVCEGRASFQDVFGENSSATVSDIEVTEVCLFSDKNGTKYFTYLPPCENFYYTLNDGTFAGYAINTFSEDGFIGHWSYSLIENYTLYISKDAFLFDGDEACEFEEYFKTYIVNDASECQSVDIPVTITDIQEDGTIGIVSIIDTAEGDIYDKDKWIR